MISHEGSSTTMEGNALVTHTLTEHRLGLLTNQFHINIAFCLLARGSTLGAVRPLLDVNLIISLAFKVR